MKHFSVYILILVVAVTFYSCKKTVQPTIVVVEDSIRNYSPMVLNDDLYLTYRLSNEGDEPFVITDVQPDCGSIIESKSNKHIILPGKSVDMQFRYNSARNRGDVHHAIRLFGNVVPKGVVTLEFSVNVVSPSGVEPDYEEIYHGKNGLQVNDPDNPAEEKITEHGYYVPTMSGNGVK